MHILNPRQLLLLLAISLFLFAANADHLCIHYFRKQLTHLYNSKLSEDNSSLNSRFAPWLLAMTPLPNDLTRPIGKIYQD